MKLFLSSRQLFSLAPLRSRIAFQNIAPYCLNTFCSFSWYSNAHRRCVLSHLRCFHDSNGSTATNNSLNDIAVKNTNNVVAFPTNATSLAPTPREALLDSLLQEAQTHPGKRREFYSALMEPDRKVFLALATKSGFSLDQSLLSSTDFRFPRITIDEKDYIPFFSSLAHIKAPFFMELEMKELFELAQKSQFNLIMNPSSEVIKLLSWEEISALLDGSIFSDSQVVPFEAESQLSICRLAADSAGALQLTSSLSHYFAQHPGIKRSWLAKHGDPPMILIAVEAEKADFDQVMGAAGPIINSVKDLPFDGVVDVFRVDFDGPSYAFCSGDYGEAFYVRANS